jgi:hypothetical protein
MIYPHLNYTEAKATTQEETNNLVNASYRYCQTITDVFEFIGKCRHIDLPSFHPYWKNEVKRQDYKTLQRVKAMYEECKADTKKIAYYFNATASLIDIESKIRHYEKQSEGVIL